MRSVLVWTRGVRTTKPIALFQADDPENDPPTNGAIEQLVTSVGHGRTRYSDWEVPR
jgi:hypothetical protein